MSAHEADYRSVLVTRASDVRTIKQPFFAHDLIPTQVLTLIAGRAGEGKSTLSLAIAAKATNGQLDGDWYGHKLTVAISASEDTKALQRIRLEAAGADLDRIAFVEMATHIGPEVLETGMEVPRDIPYLRDALKASGAKAWFIDPLTGVMRGDSNNRDAVRAALDPLHVLARELDIAIIGVLHFSKGAGRAGEKVSGSHAFRDVARSLLVIAKDDESEDRILTLDKSNYSTAAGQSWKFQIEDTAVTTTDGTTEHVGRATDLTESDISVNDVINRELGSAEDQEDKTDSEKWLIAYLEDPKHAGTAPSSHLIRDAVNAGFSKSAIQRVGKRLCDKGSSGFRGEWSWTLKPQGSQHTSQGSHAQERGNLGNLGDNLGAESPQGVQGVTSQDMTPSTPSLLNVTPSLTTCPACNGPMKLIKGFTTHPGCMEEAS